MKKFLSLLFLTVFTIIAINAAVDLGDQHAPFGLPSDCKSWEQDIADKEQEIKDLQQRLSDGRRRSGVLPSQLTTLEKEISERQEILNNLKKHFDQTPSCQHPVK